MDRDEVVGLITQLRQGRSWVDAVEVRAARRTRQLEAEGRAESAAGLLGDEGRRSGRDARAAADREVICTAMPGFEDALAAGDVAAGHLDALANATRGLDEETRAEFLALETDLLADAERQRVDTFDRSCRDLARSLAARSRAKSDADELDEQRRRSTVKRWTDTATGMKHTHLELDPIRDAALWSAIDAQRARLRQQDGNRRTPWAQLQVESVVAAVSGGEAVRRVPEVTVLIDLASLIHGVHERTVCETDAGVPVPASTVRRLCCEAEVLPVVLNGDGEALDADRSVRTANRAQRRALRAMHRTCAHPDCTVSFEACRIHHVVPWLEGRGATDIDNLLRPRRWMGPGDDGRPGGHLVEARRRGSSHRPDRRPSTTGRWPAARESTARQSLTARRPNRQPTVSNPWERRPTVP
jgi:hypothetical protein